MFGAGTAKAQSSNLKSMVRVLNDQMPMSMGVVGDMTEISINKDYLEFTATVDESIINIEALKSQPELIKENIRLFFLNKDENMRVLLDELVPAGVGLKLTYVGRDSGNKVSTMLTLEELKDLSNSERDEKDPLALLEAQLRLTNAQLPNDLGNGMVNTKMVLEGDYVVYYYICDEDQYDIDSMKENIPLLKQLLIHELNDNKDPTIAVLRQICKDANKGIAFTYQGETTGKKASIMIPVEELK